MYLYLHSPSGFCFGRNGKLRLLTRCIGTRRPRDRCRISHIRQIVHTWKWLCDFGTSAMPGVYWPTVRCGSDFSCRRGSASAITTCRCAGWESNCDGARARSHAMNKWQSGSESPRDYRLHRSAARPPCAQSPASDRESKHV